MKLTPLMLALFLCGTLSGCAQRYYNVATEREEIYFYSTEKEVRMGRAVAREVEGLFKADDDILVQQRARETGAKLAAVCDRRDIGYHFTVLDGEEVNAFALPGGYVYIFRGLWDKISEKDDYIAAVLAHEISHITARHTVKRLQNSIGYGALAVLAGVVPGADGYSRVKAAAGINQLLLAYSREEEMEADTLAARYLSRAGYDPNAVIHVLEILQQTQRERPVQVKSAPTHPYISERLRAVREEINRGSIGFVDYINTGDPRAPRW